MLFTETKLKGAFLIGIQKLEDERGFFARTWCDHEMAEHGINVHIVQANTSLNLKKGTLRGMHFQKSPYEEAKLVRCIRGAIYDVIVDLRTGSPTFKQWFGVELTADNYKMLFIPEHFAHGFITLEDNSEITYMMSQFYKPGYDAGFRWNDPAFNINWPVEVAVISEKDNNHPDFNENNLL
ncbi:MAG TPA: dTDP-4-dehydrorhamnose 3,5-epimerase [Bacteroidetes bacterium]|nr:dTDP-4-dehydrorhamnose 3,5-epimerase [Bacteroidota bacterium]